MRLILIAVYFGIGFACHAAFLGSTFNWSSAWTWGWLLGWPFLLVVSLGVFALAICAFFFVACGVVAFSAPIWKPIANWRRQRRMRRINAARRGGISGGFRESVRPGD